MSLFGPFYTACISVGYHSTIAHICDERGVMIASYNSDNKDWTIVPTAEEMQFQYEANQIYGNAYQEALTILSTKEQEELS